MGNKGGATSKKISRYHLSTADPPLNPDNNARDVARAGGADFTELSSCELGVGARAVALEVMTKGLIDIIVTIREEGRCDAVFSFGGSGGSGVISEAMRSLPFGVPKLLLSTMSSGDAGNYISAVPYQGL